MSPRVLLPLIAVLLGCSQTPQQSSSRSDASSAAPRERPPSVVSIAINEDPPNFWDIATQVGGAGGRQLLPVVNQFLAVSDADGAPHPRLLNELPSVERGTWTLRADGTMETTWRLRPGARWHDGQPFTADDVVFSWQVNRDPDVPNANRTPADQILEMRTPDPMTVVATWARVYPFADRLGDRELVPVPRHILERAYIESKETLLLHPYWTMEYVGLGPYTLAQWQRGAYMELDAFDAYFLGRPKIDRLRVMFIPDPNTMVANLYARSVQTVLPPGDPELDAILLVKADWENRSYGTVLVYPVRWTFLDVQQRRNPQPPEMADARVRRALLTLANREELVRALFGDYGILADSWVQPGSARFPTLQGAVARYPYDPTSALDMLRGSGWQRGADGTLTSGAGLPFSTTIRGDERVAAIVADQWKRGGISVHTEVLAPQLQRDRAARASFTGMDINTGPTTLLNVANRLASELIPAAENQWTGLNRGGYASAAWDRLASAVLTTLEEARRVDLEREMLRQFMTDVPLLPLYFGLESLPIGGGLVGLQPIRGNPHTGTILHTWNVHEWTLRG